MERLHQINRILTIVVIALCATVVILFARVMIRRTELSSSDVTVSNYANGYPKKPESVHIFYLIDTDKFLDREPASKKEYFAYARYIEAAIYYEAYHAAGEEEKAARYLSVMEENAALFPEENRAYVNFRR